MKNTNIPLLVQIAKLYYEQGKTQQEIAEIFKFERSRVSRLLLEARKRGIVQFQIIDPSQKEEMLAFSLKEQFGLQDAVVVNVPEISEDNIKKAIGIFAAQYLGSILRHGDVLAVSWGDTVQHTVQNLKPGRQIHLTVVPAIGGSGILTESYMVNNMAEKLADHFGGTYQALYAPAFVDSADTRDALLKSKDLEPVIRLWNEATVVLVGIGKRYDRYSRTPNALTQFGQFYFTEKELAEIEEKRAVGDINAHFFNSAGKELDVSIHRRTIGMSIGQLKRVRTVIAVAGGASKIPAIRGALKGALLDVLVTDSQTAQSLLEDESGEAAEAAGGTF